MQLLSEAIVLLNLNVLNKMVLLKGLLLNTLRLLVAPDMNILFYLMLVGWPLYGW